MFKQILLVCTVLGALPTTGQSQDASHVVWQIGQCDGSSSEFALAPDRYAQFVEQDFGYEDRYYLVGYSEAGRDMPYVLPGPDDTWGGTSPTAGWRTHEDSK